MAERTTMLELGDELAALHAMGAVDTTQLDAAVGSATRRHFSRISQLRWAGRRRRWSQLAAAAALAFTAFPAAWLTQPGRTAGPALAGDINGDRRLDILDAFALARRIDSGNALSVTLDYDGNGHVDQRDVDIVAASAVTLGADATQQATVARDTASGPRS